MDNKKLKQEIEKGKVWVKKQKPITYSKKFKLIKATKYDDIKDFVMDKKGFFLIRIYKDVKEIGVGFVEYKTYQILYEVRGKTLNEIVNTIFNKINTKIRLDHAAYLGKELKKAEIALYNNTKYLQE